MVYQVDRILRDVRVCLDRNRTSTALIEGNDIETLTLDEEIQSKIEEAVDRVHMAAPYYLLEQGHNINVDVEDEDDSDADGDTDEVVSYAPGIHWAPQECGWILLPEDFLRLVVFQMSDWERPVYSVITPDTPEYKKQRSRVKALRGTSQRPVCALVVRPEGKALEFYSCKSNEATVDKAVYIPHAAIDEYGGVDISERCYDAVVYTIAALALASMNEPERANLMLEKANTYLTK
jgi:hypothetical protein